MFKDLELSQVGRKGQETGLGYLLDKKRVGVRESIEAEGSPTSGKGKEFGGGQFRNAEGEHGSWTAEVRGVEDI